MEKDSDGISRIKCHKKLGDNTVCNGFFDPKLKFRFGKNYLIKKVIFINIMMLIRQKLMKFN